MKRNRASNVITTRVLSDGELDNLMNSIGAHLMSQGFTPLVNTKKLLDYRPAAHGKRATGIVIQVEELPVSFSVDDGPQVSIAVGLAFGISAPAPLYQALASMLVPYAADVEQLKGNAGQFLAGRAFNKKVPGVACDHCGHIQEVTIPFSITRIEGNCGYGPGGSATVVCSNRACNRSFPVTWDDVIIEIDMMGE